MITESVLRALLDGAAIRTKDTGRTFLLYQMLIGGKVLKEQYNDQKKSLYDISGDSLMQLLLHKEWEVVFKGLTFADAIEQFAKYGHSIRRRSKPDRVYHSTGYLTYSFTKEDMLADDWEGVGVSRVDSESAAIFDRT